MSHQYHSGSLAQSSEENHTKTILPKDGSASDKQGWKEIELRSLPENVMVDDEYQIRYPCGNDNFEKRGSKFTVIPVFYQCYDERQIEWNRSEDENKN